MRSLSEEDRLARLQEHLELWEVLLEKPSRPGTISDEQREKGLIDAVVRIAAQEIYEAFLEDPVACVFCDLFSIDDTDSMKKKVLAVIPEGLRQAARTYAWNRAKPVDEHVKSCMAAKLANLRDRLRTEALNKRPQELLPAVLEWPRPKAVVLLEHLTSEQRDGLLELLFERTDRESLVVQLSDEPEDELLWRLWYTAVLQVIDPAVSDLLEGSDRPIFVLLGEAWGKRLSEGKNPASPLHAKYYHQLARGLSKDGYRVDDPTSVSRVARLTGKSRSTIDRYLASEVQIKLIPDEDGNVQVRFTPEDIRRSIEAVRGAKRGPKS